MPVSQLTLPLKLPTDASFENFVGSDSQRIVSLLQNQLSENTFFTYICGGPDSGKTHLLSAICLQAGQYGKRVAYLPARELVGAGADAFDGMDLFSVVCIDDVDALFGDRDTEVALFHLFNRLRDQGGQLFVSASELPVQAVSILPDLRSRLSSGLVVQPRRLDDEERVEAFRQMASDRGIHLSDEVVHFVMKRSGRALSDLNALLDTLDQASLTAHRKITVPFVKELFGW